VGLGANRVLTVIFGFIEFLKIYFEYGNREILAIRPELVEGHVEVSKRNPSDAACFLRFSH
jgi:hypothetical protein